MKIQYSLFFFLLIPLFIACEEDEDKTIQTDLTKEASQLFDISNNWGESLYFAMLSWEDYQAINSNDLPGCPKITLDSNLNQVTLEFLPDTSCIETGKTNRTGKILLDYFPENLPNQDWILEYQNYTINQDSLLGIREFSRSNLNKVSEQFENLIIKSPNGLNSKFSGNLIHTTTNLRLELIGISSIGTITGTTPVGRHFTTEFTSPRQTLVSCIRENEILPITGKESWTVARGSNKKITHQLTYETAGECRVIATVVLSDGRNLVLTF
jgi:hypothetical protein